MSSIFVRIEQDVLDFIKGAGKVVEVVTISAAEAAVVAAGNSPLGELALSAVQIIANHDLTGEQKMTSVIGMLEPIAPALLAKAGLPAISGPVEGFLRALVQGKVNTLQSVATAAATGVVTKLADEASQALHIAA